ncbi:ABC transporter substrate-binding protein [Vagococcus acidifermentans]|uniref:Sugar ABC transporter substrate-binding protein n=1 Tax=Vagococcus acidifermentans TaxID=564710 RepID=A0A430AXQ9_9ENTE|nr:ABC transporter substrate-binding protein [Vagococcus acidifermentans]RSU12838.1 sugar ABC transporter substrate-binding protein [Vagococcus acidifermentans]
MKKFMLAGLCVLGLGLAACGGGEKKDSGSTADKDNQLIVWTFTDELSTMINDYYLPAHKDLDFKVKVVAIPSEQFETKLDPVLGSKDAPDVIALESAFVKKYVESGMMADIGSLGLDEASENTFQYVKDVGTSKDGVLRALAWQAAPGAFYYRDSLAKELLGADSPEQVQERISDYDKFYDAAKEISEKSNNGVYMISGIQDLAKPFFGQREHGWVEDNKLVVDDSLLDLMDLSKKFVEEKLTQDTEGQSEAWFSGMSGDSIFGYSLPTWGLHYWLKPNAVSSDKAATTEGDWRMVQGAASWFWGGTWIGVTETSDKKEAAASLIKYLTTDEEFLTKWAKDTGDFVSSQTVVNEIKDDFSEEFLGGQNHYYEFSQMVENINATILTEYDQTIESLFNDNCLTPYSKGEVSKDEAIDNFKAAVGDAYPDLEID